MRPSARCKAIRVTFVMSCLVLVAPSVWASTGNDKCVDRLNNDGRKVLAAEHAKNRLCIKNGSGDVTACIDAVGAKTIVKENKTTSDDLKKCTPLPAFAYAGAAVVNGAAQRAANGIAHDVFGPVVAVGSTADEKKCQQKVADATGKLAITKWQVYRKCKHDGLAGFADAAALATACLGGPAGPQPDPGDKILKKRQKLEDLVQAKCLDATVALDILAGSCAGETTAPGFASCVDERVECQVCRAIQAADAFSTSQLDCDLFDDGVANASCADVSTPTPTSSPVPTPTPPAPTDTPTPPAPTDTPTPPAPTDTPTPPAPTATPTPPAPTATPTAIPTSTPRACNPVDCDDGLRCTDDSCNSSTGVCNHVVDLTNCGQFPSCATASCSSGHDCELVFHDEMCPSSSVSCLAPRCTVSGCGSRDICGASNPQCENCADCSCNIQLNKCVKSCPS